MEDTVECSICSKQFTRNYIFQKICSDECRYTAQKLRNKKYLQARKNRPKPPAKYNCIICNKLFKRKNKALTCGKRCSHKLLLQHSAKQRTQEYYQEYQKNYRDIVTSQKNKDQRTKARHEKEEIKNKILRVIKHNYNIQHDRARTIARIYQQFGNILTLADIARLFNISRQCVYIYVKYKGAKIEKRHVVDGMTRAIKDSRAK